MNKQLVQDIIKNYNDYIKDNLSLVSKYYIYSVDTDSCVVTKDYVSEYIKPANRGSNFKTIKYDDINGIRIIAQ